MPATPDPPACPSCRRPLIDDALYCQWCGVATPTRHVGEGADAVPDGEESEYRRRLQSALGSDYELGDLMGEGGFGRVFHAHQRSLNRSVAVKAVRDGIFANATVIERFRREAQAAARVQHPGIVPVHAIGEGEGLVYIVMALVSGETLRERVARPDPLGAADIAGIVREVAGALQAAHDAGIVHRDVKPENVMLEATSGRALLMDFGIAKPVHAELDLTGTHGFIGTPAYMSPEQAAGEPIDHRSDLYSLGVTAFQMATGELPYDAPTPQAMAVEHLHGTPKRLAALRPDLSPEFAGAIMKCLAKAPDERWSNAAALAAALADVAVPESSRPTRESRTSWRRAAALSLAGAAAVAAVWWLAPRSPASVSYSTRQVTFSGSVRRVELSPDGAHIVFQETGSDGQSVLRVRELEGTVSDVVVRARGQGIWGFRWVDDARLEYMTGVAGNRWAVLRHDVASGDATECATVTPFRSPRGAPAWWLFGTELAATDLRYVSPCNDLFAFSVAETPYTVLIDRVEPGDAALRAGFVVRWFRDSTVRLPDPFEVPASRRDELTSRTDMRLLADTLEYPTVHVDPSGRGLLYQKGGMADRASIWHVALETGETRLVLDTAHLVGVTASPSRGSAGALLAFHMDESDGERRRSLYAYPAEWRPVPRLGPPARIEAVPDSVRWINVASGRMAWVDIRLENHQLEVIRSGLASAVVERVTSSTADWIYPSMAPAGDRLAVVRRVPGSADLFVIDAQDYNQRRAIRTARAIAHPRWSPDGALLAAWVAPDTGAGLVLELIDEATGERRTLNQAVTRGGPLRWGPDGRYLLMTETGGGGGPLGTCYARVELLLDATQEIGCFESPVLDIGSGGELLLGNGHVAYPGGAIDSTGWLDGRPPATSGRWVTAAEQWVTVRWPGPALLHIVNGAVATRRDLPELQPGRPCQAVDVSPDGDLVLCDESPLARESWDVWVWQPRSAR